MCIMSDHFFHNISRTMNDKLTYKKGEKILIKNHFDERWLQDRIEEEPSILGLGDLEIVKRERKQSSGGRIDFLFIDQETQTMYETEIMLGETDESHIIRTIEYWDIERRRFPSKDHKAVIVAEEITNRFFNVISLMNRSIPIIAIQLNALNVDNSIVLNFTKVLDIYEPPEDEEDLSSETVDRNFWEKKSNSSSISVMDDLVTIIKELPGETRVTYNKHHVAVGTTRKNYIWFHPRKKENYVHLDFKVGKENVDRIKEIFESVAISFTLQKEDKFVLVIQKADVKQHSQKIGEVFRIAKDTFK